MMKTAGFGWTIATALALAAAPLAGQGKGNGNGNGNGKGNDHAQAAEHGRSAQADRQQQGKARGRGQSDDAVRGHDDDARGNADARGNGNGNGRGNGNAAAAGRGAGAVVATPGHARGHRPDRPDPARLRASVASLPGNAHGWASSSDKAHRMAAGALARAKVRGADLDRLDLRDDASGVHIRNGDHVLLDLDRRQADDLGYWEMRRLGDHQATEQAPAFCRSGAGHPVWGRQWCLDKGFGLGVQNRTIWSRTTSPGDIIFGRTTTQTRLDRPSLAQVLGDIVFGRLALQSLALGYTEPLSGTWVTRQNDSPRILLVNSGDRPVAELTDSNLDGKVDVLFVVQPRW